MQALAVWLTEITSWQLAAFSGFSGDLLPPRVWISTGCKLALKHEASACPLCTGWLINSCSIKKSKVTSVFWKRCSPVLHDIASHQTRWKKKKKRRSGLLSSLDKNPTQWLYENRHAQKPNSACCAHLHGLSGACLPPMFVLQHHTQSYSSAHSADR